MVISIEETKRARASDAHGRVGVVAEGVSRETRQSLRGRASAERGGCWTILARVYGRRRAGQPGGGAIPVDQPPISQSAERILRQVA